MNKNMNKDVERDQNIIKEGDMSPWSGIDNVEMLCVGVYSVSTASHGGVWVAPYLRELLPQDTEFSEQGWYEEDCAAAIPLAIFATRIYGYSGKNVLEQSMNVWRDYFPNLYERWFDAVINTKESVVRSHEEFFEINKMKYIATAAWGSWAEGVPEGMVGVHAVRSGDKGTESTYWFVSTERYAKRGRFGYVIDASIDQQTDWRPLV